MPFDAKTTYKYHSIQKMHEYFTYQSTFNANMSTWPSFLILYICSVPTSIYDQFHIIFHTKTYLPWQSSPPSFFWNISKLQPFPWVFLLLHLSVHDSAYNNIVKISVSFGSSMTSSLISSINMVITFHTAWSEEYFYKCYKHCAWPCIKYML